MNAYPVFQEDDGKWWYIDALGYTVGPFEDEDLVRAAYKDYLVWQGRCPTCDGE